MYLFLLRDERGCLSLSRLANRKLGEAEKGSGRTVYVFESTRRRDMISMKRMPREKTSVGRSNSRPLMISGLM
jgi:hypothetical protein